MAFPVSVRVKKRRDELRRQGMRPIQIWVPDTRQPNFSDECRRQSQLVSLADQHDDELNHLMNDVLESTDGWEP